MKTIRRGFTLIELMIAVSIIGILASIAYPSYIDQVRSSKRAEAQGALVSFANAMEQWELENGSYLGAAENGVDVGPPAIFSNQVPVTRGAAKTYDLTIAVATATTYTLRATPTDPADGFLELTSTGNKTCQVATACRNGNGTTW